MVLHRGDYAFAGFSFTFACLLLCSLHTIFFLKKTSLKTLFGMHCHSHSWPGDVAVCFQLNTCRMARKALMSQPSSAPDRLCVKSILLANCISGYIGWWLCRCLSTASTAPQRNKAASILKHFCPLYSHTMKIEDSVVNFRLLVVG